MQTIDKLLGIKYPVILAPMFLVTTPKMVKIATEYGITGAIPAMNYRNDGELYNAITQLKSETDKPFGINLIVNRSNTRYKKQLHEILQSKPAFVLSSLGNPSELILEAHKQGIKVFCDVVDIKFARKAEDAGADALIAVNSSAGGHSGYIERDTLITKLINECKIPIINAGGVANYEDLNQILNLGAAGASIGTVFIASNECEVSEDYKNALIKYGSSDIVLTKKLSGAPTTVINTDYVKTTGTKTNFLEWLINKNTFLKKTAKSLITSTGMSKLKKAAFSNTYKTVWVASVSIEKIKKIRPLNDIIKDITENLQ